MNVRLWEELVQAIGVKALKEYGISEDENRWRKEHILDLSYVKRSRIEHLMELVSNHLECKGAKTALHDCKQWLSVLDGKDIKARTVEKFESLLTKYLMRWLEEVLPEEFYDAPVKVKSPFHEDTFIVHFKTQKAELQNPG